MGRRSQAGSSSPKTATIRVPRASRPSSPPIPSPTRGAWRRPARVQELAESLGEGDLLLALISGGASALLADPRRSIELADLKKLTSDLLKSGADIGEINTVRKHVSVLKGGGLVRLAHPAPTIALLLSDVVGDEPSSIASGLTAPDPTTLDNTRRVLERYGIEPPESVAEYLQSAEETPASDDPIFENVVNLYLRRRPARGRGRGEEGGGARVHAAAAHHHPHGRCPRGGLDVRGDRQGGTGERQPCPRHRAPSSPAARRRLPCAGSGTGGPNQEFALALAVELDGVEGWAAFSADTDGNDGSTDAAGGIVDGETAQTIRDAGTDPEGALADNDSYAALEAGGALLVTGPDRHQRQRPAGGAGLRGVTVEGCIEWRVQVPFFSHRKSYRRIGKYLGGIGRSLMYEQVYEPIAGNLALSTLVAVIPILVLFVLLAGLRIAAQWASLVTLAVALVIAVLVYGMPIGLALNSTLLGIASGSFP